MGLEFRTEQERNPVYVGPSVEELKIKELENEITLLNEFLELVGRGHVYDLWKAGKETGENVIDLEEWEPKPKEDGGN